MIATASATVAAAGIGGGILTAGTSPASARVTDAATAAGPETIGSGTSQAAPPVVLSATDTAPNVARLLSLRHVLEFEHQQVAVVLTTPAPQPQSHEATKPKPKPKPAPEPVTAATQAPAPAATTPPPPATSGTAQQIAESLLASYGWSTSQFSCLQPLWQEESGWSVTAENPSSGAYGIPQALPGDKMASAGSDWQTDATTQIKWGLSYIQSTYGSPCAAWDHEQADGWY